MTYRLALRLSGLSLQQAGGFHDVRRSSVEHWAQGRRRVPPDILAQIHDLIHRQMRAAIEGAETIRQLLEREPDTEAIDLARPTDDHEAQSLGFPTLSAWDAMAGMILALLPLDTAARVVVVPRGSTPSTAAAADAHDRARGAS